MIRLDAINYKSSINYILVELDLVDLDGCQISQTSTEEYLQYRQVAYKKTNLQMRFFVFLVLKVYGHCHCAGWHSWDPGKYPQVKSVANREKD